jgi:hypothetical protein
LVGHTGGEDAVYVHLDSRSKAQETGICNPSLNSIAGF